MAAVERARVDVWLWAVRMFRSRSAANDACRTGRVRVGDNPAKPATRVRLGDEVLVRLAGRRVHLRVERVIVKRVGAQLALDCYEDLTPEAEAEMALETSVSDPTSGRRDRGSGRPTKQDRRRLDRLRGG